MTDAHNAPARDPADALAQLSRAVTSAARDLGLGALASELEADARRRLSDQRLRVAVVGEIKHGKSTLINALVGSALLPMGVTPTTGAVVSVRASEAPRRVVVAPDGSVADVDDDAQFNALARGRGDQLISRLEVDVRSTSLPASLELVDTPGLNDIARVRGALSRSMLPRADVLLIVLDATQLVSRTEVDMLRDAIAALGGVDGATPALEIVVNRIDLVPGPERPLILDHVRQQLRALVGRDLEPWTTNAKRALLEPDADDEDVRAVDRLRQRLSHWVADRGEILPSRMRASLLRACRLLRYNAELQLRAIDLEDEALEREIAGVRAAFADGSIRLERARAEVARHRGDILAASHARIGKFEAALTAEAVAQIRTLDHAALSDVFPGAIHDAFIDFVRHEAEQLRGALDDVSRAVIATHGEHAQRRLAEATMHLSFIGPTLYVDPPSAAIEAGLIALGVVGTAIIYLGGTVPGALMAIASPLLTMALRERAVKSARGRATERVPETIERVMEDLRVTVGALVERHGEGLLEYVATAHDSLEGSLHAGLERARSRRRELAESAKARLSRASAAAVQTPADRPSAGMATGAAGEQEARATRPTRERDEQRWSEVAMRTAKTRARQELLEHTERLEHLTARLTAMSERASEGKARDSDEAGERQAAGEGAADGAERNDGAAERGEA